MAESAFRVTTYEFLNDEGTFGGTLYDLTLQQDLAADYFVMIYSAGAGAGAATGGRGPDENFARITRDPNGTGDLTASSGADVIRLERQGSLGAWQGSVVVVESLGGAKDPNGFQLRAVKTINMPNLAVAATASLTGGEVWDDVDQCTAHWDHAGGGVECASSNTAHHPDGLSWLELIDVPSSEQIKIWKDGGGGGAADHVCYLVEWGAAWTVTSLSATGSNGGLDVNATGEWNTISIGATVTRASTFLFCGGNSSDDGVGGGALGTVYALGNGITESATETVVAFAGEYAVSRKVRMFVMEHAGAVVDYRSPSIGSADATGSQTVDAAGGTETYDNTSSGLRWTKGTRMPLHWGTCQATGNAFPRPFLGSRHTSSTNVDWHRSRQGLTGETRLISVDLDAIERLVLRPDPAVATASGPAVTLDFAAATIDLTPGPAVATAAGPAVALSLLLSQSAAVATAAGPAVAVDLELILAVSPAVASASSPAVAVTGLGAGVTLTPGPAVATAAVDIRGHPPSFIYPQSAAVASASSPAVALSLLLSQSAAVATAVAPVPQLELRLAQSAAVATAAAPAPQLALLLPQTPAVLTAVAPAPVVVRDLLLQPAPAILTAAAPAVAILTPALTLALSPAVLQVLLPSPLLDLPGIEVVEFNLALCRSPQPDLFAAMQLEFPLQATRASLRDLEPARQADLELQFTRELSHSLER